MTAPGRRFADARVKPPISWTLKLVGLAFTLHWIWETLHASAYVETQGSLVARALHCLPMAAVDAVWTLGLYLAARGLVMIARRERDTTPLLCALVLVGAASAIALEKFALATNRWTYTTAMPVVPFLGVGLWPTLQMMIVPAFIAWLLTPSAASQARSDSPR